MNFAASHIAIAISDLKSETCQKQEDWHDLQCNKSNHSQVH